MSQLPSPRSNILSLEDWGAAAKKAVGCSSFHPDVEEEQIADEAVSCYNCRYRRWAQKGILCLADPA